MSVDLGGLSVGVAEELLQRAERDLARGGELGCEGVAEVWKRIGRTPASRQAFWKRSVTLLPSSGWPVCGCAKTRCSSPL
jgi:hypothetical protein